MTNQTIMNVSNIYAALKRKEGLWLHFFKVMCYSFLGSLLIATALSGQTTAIGWEDTSPLIIDTSLLNSDTRKEYKVEIRMKYFMVMKDTQYYWNAKNQYRKFGTDFEIDSSAVFNVVIEPKWVERIPPGDLRLQIPMNGVKTSGILKKMDLSGSIDIFPEGTEILKFKVIPDTVKTSFSYLSIDFKFFLDGKPIALKIPTGATEKLNIRNGIPIQISRVKAKAIPLALRFIGRDTTKGIYTYRVFEGKRPFKFTVDDRVNCKLNIRNRTIELNPLRTDSFTLTVIDGIGDTLKRTLFLENREVAPPIRTEVPLRIAFENRKALITGGRPPFTIKEEDNNKFSLQLREREIRIDELNKEAKMEGGYRISARDSLSSKSNILEIPKMTPRLTSGAANLWWILILVFLIFLWLIFGRGRKNKPEKNKALRSPEKPKVPEQKEKAEKNKVKVGIDFPTSVFQSRQDKAIEAAKKEFSNFSQFTAHERRKAVEYATLQLLSKRTSKISFKVVIRNSKNIPEKYEITYDNVKSIKGIKDDKSPIYGLEHILEIKLGPKYPELPATCRFLTPVWHPNIKSSGATMGRVCYNAKELPTNYNLDELVVLIGEMLQYKNYHAILDQKPYPEDIEVAKWITEYAEPKHIVNFKENIVVDDSYLLDPIRGNEPPGSNVDFY